VKRYERIAGLLLLVFGVTIALYSWLSLELGSFGEPGSGFIPFLASSVMALCAGLWVVGNLGKDENPQPFWANKAWLRPALATGLVLLYASTMESLGYVLSTLVFIVTWQVLVERSKWRTVALVSVSATAAMWLLFTELLGVPVPKGIFTL
jgi:putative tricarboxylic transport membrane protein